MSKATTDPIFRNMFFSEQARALASKIMKVRPEQMDCPPIHLSKGTDPEKFRKDYLDRFTGILNSEPLVDDLLQIAHTIRGPNPALDDLRHRTVKYFFHHMRCGIFVQVKDGRLSIFAPFVNTDYRNNWGTIYFSSPTGDTFPPPRSTTTTKEKKRGPLIVPGLRWI